MLFDTLFGFHLAGGWIKDLIFLKWFRLMVHLSKFRKEVHTEQFCIFFIINTLIMSKCFTIWNSSSYCFSSRLLVLLHNGWSLPYHISIFWSYLLQFDSMLHLYSNEIWCPSCDLRSILFLQLFPTGKSSSTLTWKLLLHKQSFLPHPFTFSLSKVPATFHCVFYRLKILR